MTCTIRLPAALCLAVAILMNCSMALAAGLFISPRGVRPLGRGGAFVAGAEGLDALGYNPAGLAEGPSQVLLDFGVPVHRTTYTRRVFPDSAPEPSVLGQGLGMPSPTLGVSHHLGMLPELRVGIALMADYPLMQNWPDALENGEPAPQRYALLNYEGSAMTKFALAAAYRLGDYVTLGAGVNVLWGTFAATTTVSACDGTICTQPENPDYDTRIQMIAENMLTAAPHLGAIVKPLPWLRVGVSWEAGYTLEKTADLHVRMPSAGIYRDATISPDEPKGKISMRLPMTLRTGVEARFAQIGRLEASFVYEPWSVHDSIRIDTSNVLMRDVLALEDYQLAAVTIDRGLRNTYSIRLGSEWYPHAFGPFTVRAGLAYEPSAVPDETLTVMSVDMDKFIGAIGLDYDLGMLKLSLMYAYVYMPERHITTSRVLQTNPTRPAFEGRTPIGNGTYNAHAHILGLGLTFSFGETYFQDLYAHDAPESPKTL